MKKTGILCAFLLGGTVVSNAGKTKFSSPLLKGKNAVSWQFEQLQSAPGKKEVFKKVSPEQVKVTLKESVQKLTGGAVEYQFNAINKSGKQLFLRSVIELTVNRKKVKFFNGYENMRKIVFDPNDVTLSNWFPTNLRSQDSPQVLRCCCRCGSRQWRCFGTCRRPRQPPGCKL